MKKTLRFFLVIAVLCTLGACSSNFDQLVNNPNRPAAVPPSLILRGIESDLNEGPWSLAHRQNQFWCCNYNYYGTNEYWTKADLNFLTLNNVLKMEEAAKSSTKATPYGALGKLFKAMLYTRMTQKVGDLPLSEALKGLDVKTPAYDTQKDVFIQILKWLDESNAEFKTLIASNDISLDGDFLYNNDLTKWRKAVNTFTLRVLISLSKKEGDSDLNIKMKFATIVGNPTEYPVMTSNSDNMNYIYNGTTQLYPTNPGNKGFDKGRYNMSQTYVLGLTSLNDPRVYVTCNPAKAKITAGTPATDFTSFVGAPSGENLDDMTFKAGNGVYSYANQKRYYGSLAGPEPGVQLAYWELQFNIAEGINRGWANGNAATFYQNGIRSSMAFYGIADGASISITDQDTDAVLATATASVTNYLSQPAVAYTGNNAAGLTQILTQKYLAFFQNSGQEAYFNYRRTGVPAFNSGPGTGNTGVIPRRWLYPSDESFYNTNNLNAALARQFTSGVDDVNSELWINK
jgi:Starch-binding associating with outer membrane